MNERWKKEILNLLLDKYERTAAYQKRRENMAVFLSEALGQEITPEKKKSSDK